MRERGSPPALGRLQRAASALADRFGGRDAPWRRRASPWFSRALQVLTARRGLPVVLNGEPFRVDARYRVFLQPDYEAGLAAFLRTRIADGSTCFDVGAHIGAYAMQMARWIGPQGRVVAFEAHPGTARVLRRHIALNHLAGVVRVEEVAVGAGQGQGLLYGQAGSGVSRVGAPVPEVEFFESAPVPMTTLDAYCALHQVVPDWVLIDVEGQEFNVLEGARGVLTRSSVSVVMEVHPAVWASLGWSRQAGEALVAALGRRAVPLTGQPDAFGAYGVVLLDPLETLPGSQRGEQVP